MVVEPGPNVTYMYTPVRHLVASAFNQNLPENNEIHINLIRP